MPRLQMRESKTINTKIEEISQFLVSLGIDQFVSPKTHLPDQISTSFKSIRVGTVAVDFQHSLFWTDNKVLH
jgi:hypothetical protein